MLTAPMLKVTISWKSLALVTWCHSPVFPRPLHPSVGVTPLPLLGCEEG